MLEFLYLLSSKFVVVATAIVGALLVFVAPFVNRLFSRQRAQTADSKMSHFVSKVTALFVFGGYGIMLLSVLLFIVAGFIVDLR